MSCSYKGGCITSTLRASSRGRRFGSARLLIHQRVSGVRRAQPLTTRKAQEGVWGGVKATSRYAPAHECMINLMTAGLLKRSQSMTNYFLLRGVNLMLLVLQIVLGKRLMNKNNRKGRAVTIRHKSNVTRGRPRGSPLLCTIRVLLRHCHRGITICLFCHTTQRPLFPLWAV